jgi:hypothetical protein
MWWRRNGQLPVQPPEESWKDIPGWEGFYQASETGLIWSVRSLVTLIQAQAPEGYLLVTLSANKRRLQTGVHQLIALTFIGECPDGLEVCHKDNIRMHNTSDNLEYGTRAYNAQQSVTDGNHRNARKQECPVCDSPYKKVRKGRVCPNAYYHYQ